MSHIIKYMVPDIIGKAGAESPASIPESASSAAVGSSKVSIVQVASVVDEVYGSASTASKNSTFPLQQKLIACTLLLMLKNSKLKELTLGKVRLSSLYSLLDLVITVTVEVVVSVTHNL